MSCEKKAPPESSGHHAVLAQPYLPALLVATSLAEGGAVNSGRMVAAPIRENLSPQPELDWLSPAEVGEGGCKMAAKGWGLLPASGTAALQGPFDLAGQAPGTGVRMTMCACIFPPFR